VNDGFDWRWLLRRRCRAIATCEENVDGAIHIKLCRRWRWHGGRCQPCITANDNLLEANDGEWSCLDLDARGFLCTRPEGHGGVHIAHGESHEALGTWSP
jgi:hypothetical protein